MTITEKAARGIALKQQIDALNEELKKIKVDLILHAEEAHGAGRSTATEGGGWSVILETRGGSVVVTQGAPALRSGIDLDKDTKLADLVAGNPKVSSLFDERVLLSPVAGFREIAPRLFTPKLAEKLIAAVEQDRNPSVSFRPAKES
jgi:hypothetical protein